jgi:hypothetical protein
MKRLTFIAISIKHGYSCDDVRGTGSCPYMMSEPGTRLFLGAALGYAIGL